MSRVGPVDHLARQALPWREPLPDRMRPAALGHRTAASDHGPCFWSILTGHEPPYLTFTVPGSPSKIKWAVYIMEGEDTAPHGELIPGTPNAGQASHPTSDLRK